MEHDHEIAERSDQGIGNSVAEVDLFLQGILNVAQTESEHIYNVDEKFSETKKNRPWFVILLITGVVALAGAGVIISAAFIGQSNRDVPVNIEVFDDLNLRNLLDMVSSVESSLADATNRKTALERKFHVEEEEMHFIAENEIAAIQTLGLSREEEDARVAAIEQDHAERLSVIEFDYAVQIQNIDKEITDYRAQMAAFDTKRVEEAQERQKAANAEALRFEMEKERIRAEYEAIIQDLEARLERSFSQSSQVSAGNMDALTERYQAELRRRLDPLFNDARGAQIVAAAQNSGGSIVGSSDTGGNDAASAPTEGEAEAGAEAEEAADEDTESTQGAANDAPPFIQAAVWNPSVFSAAQSAYDDIAYLSSRLLTIPWENSAPSYVSAMRNLAFGSLRAFSDEMQSYIHLVEAQTAAYETRIAELNKGLEDARAQLALYRSYLRHVTEQNGDMGYIIAYTRDVLFVFIDPLYGTAFRNTMAYVFRSGDEYIGTISVSGEDGVFTARVIELAPGKTPQPNDRILLNMR